MAHKLILFFTVFLLISQASNSQNIDIEILREINLNRNRKLDQSFVAITNTLKPVTTAIPIGMACIGLIKKDTAMIRSVLVIGASSLIQGIITASLKKTVHRPRPYVTYPEIENFADPRYNITPLNYNSGDYESFTSGHASGAFAFATSLSLEYPKWYVILPSYAWASAVAYSRLDIGVHYPSDVLMGAVFGAGSAYLCHYLNKKLFKHSTISH